MCLRGGGRSARRGLRRARLPVVRCPRRRLRRGGRAGGPGQRFAALDPARAARDGQTVLVYGSGTLAFAAVALLRHLYPAAQVWAATRSGPRAALASRLGAEAVL